MFKIDKDKERLFLYLFIILLFGKSYYIIYGWHGHLIPNAPYYIILIKDIIFLIFFSLLFSDILVNASNIVIKIFLSCICFVLLVAVSHLYNMDFLNWMQYVFRNSIMYLFVIAFSFLYVRNIDKFFDIIIYSAIANVFVGFYSVIYDNTLLFSGRVIGFLDNPNTFGALMLLAMIIATVKGSAYGNSNRYYIFIVLLVFGLIMSGSVSSILLCSMFLFLFFTFSYGNRSKKPPLFILSLFISALVYGLIYGDGGIYENGIGRFLLMLNDYDSMNTITQRVSGYKLIYSEFFEKERMIEMLLGQYEYNYRKFDSMYLVILVNFGFIVLVMYMSPLLLLINFKKYLSARKMQHYHIVMYSLIFFFLMGIGRNVFNRFPINIVIYLEIGYLLKLIYTEKIINMKKIKRSVYELR